MLTPIIMVRIVYVCVFVTKADKKIISTMKERNKCKTLLQKIAAENNDIHRITIHLFHKKKNYFLLYIFI